MLRASSSTSRTVFPTRSSSELCRRSSIFCFSVGRSATTRCRNNAVSSSRRSGDSTPLTTTLRAIVCSCASSSEDSSLPVKTTTGISDSAASSRITSSRSNPDMSGSRRSNTAQSICCSRSIASASATRADGHDVDIVVAEQFGNAQLLGWVVFDYQQPPAARFDISLDPAEAPPPDLPSSTVLSQRRRRRGQAHADGPRPRSRFGPECVVSPDPASTGSARSSPACRAGTHRAIRRSAGTREPAPKRRRRASPPVP